MTVGDKLLVVGKRNKFRDQPPMVLIGSVKIPHGAARTAVTTVKESDVYVIRPGASVSIDPAITEPKILTAIQEAAKQWNWVINPSSSVVISATAGRGKSQTQTYELSRMGLRRGTGESRETITASPWVQEIKIQQGKEILWQTSLGECPRASFSIRKQATFEPP